MRRVVGLLIIAALAWAAIAAARPPAQELVEPPQGSGGSCWEWREVDPEGNLGPPVTTVTLRNGQGKIFLKVLCHGVIEKPWPSKVSRERDGESN